MQIPEMHKCTNVLTVEFLFTCQNPPRQPVPGWDLHLNALPPLPPLLWLHLPSQHLHRQPKAFHPPSVLRQDGRLSGLHVILTWFFCSQLDSQDLRNHTFHHHLSSLLRSEFSLCTASFTLSAPYYGILKEPRIFQKSFRLVKSALKCTCLDADE